MSNFELRIEQLENRSIQIVPNKNVAATLRSIAEGVGFKLEDKWDSFQIGAKLIDFINENSDENAKLKDAVKKAAVVNVSLAGAESSVAKPAKQATGSNIIDLNNDPDVQAYLNARPVLKYAILKGLSLPDYWIGKKGDRIYVEKNGKRLNSFDLNDVVNNNYLLFVALKNALLDKQSKSRYTNFAGILEYFDEFDETPTEADLAVLSQFFSFDYRTTLDTQEQVDEALNNLLKFKDMKGLYAIDIDGYSDDGEYFLNVPDVIGFDDVEKVRLRGFYEFPMCLSKLKKLKSLSLCTSEYCEDKNKTFKVNGDISGFNNLERLNLSYVYADISFDDALKFAKLPKLESVIFNGEKYSDEGKQKLVEAFGSNVDVRFY